MHVATPYLLLPGASGAYASTPDSSAFDISPDIEIVALVALNDWTPSTFSRVASRYITSGDQRSWWFYVASSGYLYFYHSPDGISAINSNSGAAPTVTNGAYLWIKVTFDGDDGAGNRVSTFYTAAFDGTTDEPSTWSTLGTDTDAGTSTLHYGTAPLEIGSFNGGTSTLAGKIARVIIRDGIDGTTVFDFDPSIVTVHGQTSIVEQSDNNAVVTVEGGAVLYAA